MIGCRLVIAASVFGVTPMIRAATPGMSLSFPDSVISSISGDYCIDSQNVTNTPILPILPILGSVMSCQTHKQSPQMAG